MVVIAVIAIRPSIIFHIIDDVDLVHSRQDEFIVLMEATETFAVLSTPRAFRTGSPIETVEIILHLLDSNLHTTSVVPVSDFVLILSLFSFPFGKDLLTLFERFETFGLLLFPHLSSLRGREVSIVKVVLCKHIDRNE